MREMPVRGSSASVLFEAATGTGTGMTTIYVPQTATVISGFFMGKVKNMTKFINSSTY